MNIKSFISEIFEDSLAKYIAIEKKGILGLSNDIYINIIKCLVFIYGDLDLINPSITKDSKALIENMTKYGCSKDEITEFFDYFNKYDLFNVAKKLIDMYVYKQKILCLDDNNKKEFERLLQSVVNIDKNDELWSYYNNLEKNDSLTHIYDGNLNKLDEIEFLEIEPNYTEKKQKKERFSFQLDAVNGFVSIMSILVFIAIICIGVVVINIIVG